jgi:peptidoglycan/LPS O-acetylase OafA/YrhL
MDRASRRSHSNNFDALRLFGSLFVLFSHQFALMGFVEPLVIGGTSFGGLGVLMFFSMSGFLVTGSWNGDSNVERFVLRRTLRIAPGLIVAIVGMFLLTKLLGAEGFPNNPWHLLNGSLWTIKYEIGWYLLFVLVGAASLKIEALARYSGVLLFGMAVGFSASSDDAYSHLTWLGHFGKFFAIGVLMKQIPKLRSVRSVCAQLIGGSLLLFAGHYELGLLLTVPGLVILVGERSFPGVSKAGKFGDLSYGIYLYAWPVQQLWFHFLQRSAGYSVQALLSFATTVLLAFGSWHFVEKQAMKRKPVKPIRVSRAPLPVDPDSVDQLLAANEDKIIFA